MNIVMRDGLLYKLDYYVSSDNKTLNTVPYSGEVYILVQTTGEYGTYVGGEYSVLDGKKHGSYKRWYESGILKTEGTYKDGERDGVWIEYTPLGDPKIKKTWENGKIKSSGPKKW